MSKMFEWVVGFTSIGKRVNEFFSGKKQLLASLATALIATGTIVANVSQQGTSYLFHMASTPEFIAASGGWIAFFNAIKGNRIEAKLDEAAAFAGDKRKEPTVPTEGGDRTGDPA